MDQAFQGNDAIKNKKATMAVGMKQGVNPVSKHTFSVTPASSTENMEAATSEMR